MTTKLKILIIGIHGPYEPWIEIFENGQTKTWIAHNVSCRIVNVFGSALNEKIKEIDQKIYYLRWSDNRVIAYSALLAEALIKSVLMLDRYRPKIDFRKQTAKDVIWQLKMPDSLLLQGVKNISAFRKSLEFDFDFLVTTITSTYINTALLQEALSLVPASNYIGGRIEQSGIMNYQQGSFRVFSRDVVENLVQNSHRYKHWKIEDIAMGDLVSKYYSSLSELPNLTLHSISDVYTLKPEDLKKTISYRCKAIDGEKRVDSEIMKLLHHRILSGD
jgi:hypothetical protein